MTLSPTNLDEIAVLPYNGDSRGTTGLIDTDSDGNKISPYSISNFNATTVAGSSATDIELYYTTDTNVRDMEKNDPDALANNVTWTLYRPEHAEIGELPANVTAIRWKMTELSHGGSATINLTLTDINVDNPTDIVKPTINNDITYVNTKELGNAVHQLPTTTTYTGEQIGLAITNPDIQIDLGPNEAKTDIAQTLNYTVNTKNGYTLSLATTKDLAKQDSSNSRKDDSAITTATAAFNPTNTKPVAGTNNWAIRLQGNTNWQSLKTTNSPYTLATEANRTKLQSSYKSYLGISTDYNLPAGTYAGQVTYTITAGI